MALKKELLDILVCPLCLKHVQLTADSKGLKCPACRRVYPIDEKYNFPVMLPEEARIEEE
jgi:uncharacterized protein YbaR (Trm112 family)